MEIHFSISMRVLKTQGLLIGCFLNGGPDLVFSEEMMTYCNNSIELTEQNIFDTNRYVSL